MLTSPTIGPTLPDVGNSLNHIYCCDPNVGLCGTDLSDVPDEWADNAPSCVVCEAIEDTELPYCPACP